MPEGSGVGWSAHRGTVMTPEKAREYARQALLRAMEDYSEDNWCAGWMHGLENDLWRGVLHGKQPALAELSADAGGWWVWSREHGRRFVPIAEWGAMYAAGYKPER